MRLKFRNIYWLSIIVGILILASNFFFFFSFTEPIGPTNRFFYPLIIIAFTIGWAHFWLDYLKELKRQKTIEEKFVDFVRNMESAVKSGISIPQSVIQASRKDYGALTPYLRKLGHQVQAGIPIHKAFYTFAQDTKNPIIKRAITIVIEAEASGGRIEDVMESITTSLVSVEKLKSDRKSSTYSQIVQGYIVYFIFIAIMLVLQLKLFPQLGGLGGEGGLNLLGGASFVGNGVDAAGGMEALDRIFFALLLIQGAFAGIMIGKFSEGSIKQGIIHSLALVTIAALIVTTVKGGI